MNVRDTLCRPHLDWIAKEPASKAEIEQLAGRAKAELPAEYIQLLEFSNGGEGPLALVPLYFQLYTVKECILRFHDNGHFLENFPDFMFFGGNGGLEVIGFDLRHGPPWPVVMIDPIAGPESAQQIAPDMAAFIEAIGLEASGRDFPT